MTFAWTEFNKNLTFAKESRIYKSFNNLSKDSILVQYRPNLEHSLGYSEIFSKQLFHQRPPSILFDDLEEWMKNLIPPGAPIWSSFAFFGFQL